MAIILNGKEISKERKAQMKIQVEQLRQTYGRPPHLAVVLVGDDPASLSYVRGKEKACLEVGIFNTTIRLSEQTSEKELLECIAELNENPLIDGILVQLPLPEQIREFVIINAISLEKDVDGFHPRNVAGLYLKQPCLYPCTPKGILTLLKSIPDFSLDGKKAVVIGRSNIVGLPTFKMLLDQNVTVSVAHSKTENLQELTQSADILVVAVGKPKFLKAEMVRPGVVVIDVGINRDPQTNKLCGDVDFEQVEPLASYITKVPGGVGPMTICSLMENTIEVFEKRVAKK